MSVLRQLLAIGLIVGLGYGLYTMYEARNGGPGESARPAERQRQAPAVEVATAERRSLTETVEAVGTTRAVQSVGIVPLAEGRVVEIATSAGSRVAAGDVLVRLDSEIEEATLAEARATMEEKAAALARAETLGASNTVSRASIETVRAEEAIARAALMRAERRLADRTIRAPFAGVVGIIEVDLGAFVETASVIATLDDLSEVEIEFRLPETVYGQVVAEQEVTAESAAFPDRAFTGRVAVVDSRIDPVSRSFRVRARLPNDDGTLPAGMFMRLDLRLNERDGVVVPEVALGLEAGRTFVYVVEDGKAMQRPVRLGLRRDGFVEVTEGVSAGELVVSRGLQSLRDGVEVRIVNEAAANESIAAAPETPRT